MYEEMEMRSGRKKKVFKGTEPPLVNRKKYPRLLAKYRLVSFFLSIIMEVYKVYNLAYKELKTSRMIVRFLGRLE